MKIGVLGGSFDPVHNGHLKMARVAQDASLDHVLFVPAKISPLKIGRMTASVEQRLDMLRLALAGQGSAFEISTVDIEREGCSFTVDTMRILKAQYPGAELFFIMGADSLLTFGQWYKAEELAKLCTFITFARPGFVLRESDVTPFFDEAQRADLTKYMVRDFDVPVSSSEIRDAFARGEIPGRDVLPESVAAYIVEHGLYRV